MNDSDNKFIPALSFDFLTPLYDPVVALTSREKAFKRALIEQVGASANFAATKLERADERRILDIGCGTATLTISLKRSFPRAEIFGLDGDAKILNIARRKIEKSNLDIVLNEGLSFEMPYPDDYFDEAVSSLFFHHLTPENKRLTLTEILRVLKPGGFLHVADWGKPSNFLMKILSLSVQQFDGATTRDSFQGKLPELSAEAGFTDVSETEFFNTLLGTIRLQKAKKESKE